MESHTSLNSKFTCTKHKGELIQRISESIYSSNPLYCLECVVESNRTGTYDNLMKFEDYIKFACQNVNIKAHSEEDLPNEVRDLLTQNIGILEAFKEHIDQEKTKVADILKIVEDRVHHILSEYKSMIFRNLDKQLDTFRFNIDYIKSSSNKWFDHNYGTSHISPKNLEESIKLQDSTRSLAIFIKILNRDITERCYLSDHKSSENYEQITDDARQYIKISCQEIKNQCESIPFVRISQDISSRSITDHLERLFLELFRDTFALEHQINEIPPFIKQRSVLESILEITQVSANLKKEKLLPKEISPDKFNSKLQRLRTLLNETSTRIGSPSSKYLSSCSRTTLNKSHY